MEWETKEPGTASYAQETRLRVMALVDTVNIIQKWNAPWWVNYGLVFILGLVVPLAVKGGH